MFLSRLQLDPRHRETRGWLKDCNTLHRVIMSGFGEATTDAARAELGVLFRVETKENDARLISVLVQSRETPHWAFETSAVAKQDDPVDLSSLAARFTQGARFRFRLRANPTRRIHQKALEGPDLRELDTSGNWREPGDIPDGERTGIVRRPRVEQHADAKGKRVEIRREEERVAWLTRRGREHDGFRLLQTTVRTGLENPSERLNFAARADPAPVLRSYDRKLTFATALFDGVLEITDPVQFQAAFEAGIGPGKAFGCGLLSVMPMT